MAGNNIYKNHPYDYLPDSKTGATNQYRAYTNMIIDGVKHNDSINQTMIGFSKHGIDMDTINKMSR